MAGTEDQTRNEYLKDLADREQEVAIGIAQIVKDNKGSAKDRNELVKQGKALQKSHRTLGGDLTKNVQDMKDGISTTVDGMINETFGPLGGVLSTFTTGWFKRAKENRDSISATEATLEAAESNLEEIKGGKVETKESFSTLEKEQKKTTGAITGEAETKREEEREDDVQHKELIDALKALKIESIKDVGDDGGFFAGLTTIAATLGGIALGLTAPGIFTNMSQWAKAFDNFKVNMGKWFPKLSASFSEFSTKLKKFKIPTGWTTKFDDWAKTVKTLFKFDMPKMPEFPKFTKVAREFFNIPIKELNAATDAMKVVKAADYGFDSVRIASETFGDTTKLVARNAQGRFVKISDGLKDAMKLADPVGQGVIAKARSFMGIELPGFMQKSITKIDDVVKGADVAVDAAKMGGLASKVGGLAKFLTVGVVGRALSVAGNQFFDVIAMGKDVFDIASAVTDDDVKTAVKKEDIGALVGGFIGGAIGIIGGPAGVALGMGLGNMAGEFIGQAMDDPEILGAIQTVHDNLKAERKGLADEILAIQAEIDAATEPLEKERLQAQKDKLTARQTEVATELEQFTNDKSALNLQKAALLEVEARANKINADRAALELKIEAAEERGDDAMVARLEDRVTVLDKQFKQAEKDYETESEKLREVAQKTSKELVEKSTSFFDKLATGGGISGWFGKLFGGKALEGEAAENLEKGQGIKKLEEQLREAKKGGFKSGFVDEKKVAGLEEKLAALKGGTAEPEIFDKSAHMKGAVVTTATPEQMGGAAEPEIFDKSAHMKGAEMTTATAEQLGGVDVKSMAELRSDGTYGPQLSPKEASLEERNDKRDQNKRLRKFLFAESKAEREKGRGQKDQLKIRDIRNALSGVTEGTTLEKTPSYILKGFWEQEDALAKMHQGGPIKQSGKYELLAGEMVMDNQAAEIIKSVSVAGATMNAIQMERMMGRGARPTQPPAIVDASTVQNVTNNTIIRTPSPSGPNLHFEGRDFVHKIA